MTIMKPIKVTRITILLCFNIASNQPVHSDAPRAARDRRVELSRYAAVGKSFVLEELQLKPHSVTA